MKTKLNKTRGFTLVELTVVMALIGIVFLTVGNLLNFSIKSQKKVYNEYQLQSDMRIASQVVTEQIRSSSAIFMLNENQFKVNDLKEGWNYFALSSDKKQMVQYIWDSESPPHKIKPLVGFQSDLVFNMAFDKPKDDSLLATFELSAYLANSDNRKLTLKSDINAINSVVVDDSGTLTYPAVALAYRTDEIPSSEQIKVAVTMVLDTSGSMSFDMAGNPSPGYSGYNSYIFDANDVRIDHLRNRGQNLIDKFADMGNVDVSIIPFSKESKILTIPSGSGSNGFYNAKDNKESLKRLISGLSADGGTNTGDGIRRSYYQHLDYNTNNSGKVLNYTILLVDGNPTYYTKISSNNSNYYTGADVAQYIGGSGNDSSQTVSMEYIKELGNTLIKNADVDIKTFVIGFTAEPSEVSRAESIAIDHSTHPTNQARKGYYYSATNADQLSEVFDSIADKILEDVWHIYGPNR